MRPYIETIQFPDKPESKCPHLEGPFTLKQLKAILDEACEVWAELFGTKFIPTELAALQAAMAWVFNVGRHKLPPKQEFGAFRPWTTQTGQEVLCIMVGCTVSSGSSVALACSLDGAVYGLQLSTAERPEALLFVGCASDCL